MTQGPKYLTGDPSGINDFINKFDVRDFEFVLRCMRPILQTLTPAT
jgi:hypothetical protein